jgi:hypothetical protein
MKKLLTIMIALAFIFSLAIPMASAAFGKITYEPVYKEISPISEEIKLLPEVEKGEIIEITPEPDYTDTSKYEEQEYPRVLIEDWFGWLGTKETIELVYHDSCILNCRDKIKVTLSDDLQNPLSSLVIKDLEGNVLEGKSPKIQEITTEDYVANVTDYKEQCNPSSYTWANGSVSQYDNCEQIVIGSHLEDAQREILTDYVPKAIATAGEHYYYISGTKEAQESVDWVVTSMGQEVDRLAVWTSSMNTNLAAYWSFNTASGLNDSVTGAYNVTGTTNYVTGINGNAQNYTSTFYNTATQYMPKLGANNFSISFWVKTSDGCIAGVCGIIDVLGGWGPSAGGYGVVVGANSGNGKIVLASNPPWGPEDAVTINDGNWKHIVIERKGTGAGNLKYYVNGVNTFNGSQDYSQDYNFDYQGHIGATINANMPAGRFYTGLLDEVGIWTRALTEQEISDLYNGGTGLTYTNTFSGMTITNSQPADGSTISNTRNVTFACNITSTGSNNLTKITLAVNGTATWNQSISSLNLPAYNATFYNATVANGNYSWYCAGVGTDVNASSTRWAFTEALSTQINFTNPTELNNSFINHNYAEVNVTASGADFNTITISLYNSTFSLVNSTTSVTSPKYINFTGLSNQKYYINATINDSLNNKNSTETRYFTVDTTKPKVSIVYPANNTKYKVNVSTMNYTSSDTNRNTCWYSTNNGATNTTISCTSNITGLTSTEGTNIWRVYVNDSANNFNTTSVTFYKDTITPLVSITYPTATNYSSYIKYLNYTYSDTNLDKCWWTNNSGTTNTTIACGTNITIPDADGSFTYLVYVNDTYGNVNSSSVNFIVNLTKVYLNSPANGATTYSNPQSFNCSASALLPTTVKNITYWNNISGWSAKQTTKDSMELLNMTANWTAVNSATGTATATLDVNTGSAYSEAGILFGNANANGIFNKTGKNLNIQDSSLVVDFSLSNVGNGEATLLVTDGSTDIELYATPQSRTVKRIENHNEVSQLWLYSDIYGNGSYTTVSTASLNSNVGWYLKTHTAATQTGGTNTGTATIYNVWSGNKNVGWFTLSITQPTLWTCSATDSSGTVVFASENRTISPDVAAPVVSILYPTGSITSFTNGQSVELNYTATDTNLQSCWYEYNGINDTNYSCLNKMFTYAAGINTIKVWANDSLGNKNSATSVFNVTFGVSNVTYSTTAYETSLQNFKISIIYNSSLYGLVAILNYDGVNYSSTNVGYGDNGIFSVDITIPLLNNSATKNFFWYINGMQLSTYTQTLNPINLQLCNSTFNNYAINFTSLDEQSITTLVNSTFSSNWGYWLGDGSFKKNYSYSDMSLANSSWNFCITPNVTVKADVDIFYTNPSYLPREAHLSAINLSSNTTIYPLYQLNATIGIKFYFTIVQGAGVRVTDSDVEISKYNVGTGNYTFNSIRTSDNLGQFIEYLQQDTKYRFIISKNSIILGTIDQTATCTASPCEITLTIPGADPGSVFDYYNSIYANNTNSSITFDPNTKIVTYNFQDLLGTAHYFKLVVSKMSYNASENIICNVVSYTTSGNLTCDMSNSDGDFVANGYISRSPERPDAVLSFVIDILKNAQTSPYIVFFLIGWILTITLGSLAISKGNPSTTMFGFMAAWTSSKLMMFNPFSWVIIVLVDLLAVWIIYEVAT